MDPELEVNELLIIAHSGEKRGTLMFLKYLFQEEARGKHFLFTQEFLGKEKSVTPTQ